MTQVPSTAVTGLHDVAQSNSLARQFGTDRPTEKTIGMKDADFGHIPWVIANDDRFAHVGRQGEIQVPQALEMNAIRTHLAPFGDGQQQEIKLFETRGEPRQKATAIPAGLWWFTCLTMGLLMIVVQKKALQLGFTGCHRQNRLRRGYPYRRVPRQTT